MHDAFLSSCISNKKDLINWSNSKPNSVLFDVLESDSMESNQPNIYIVFSLVFTRNNMINECR